MIILDEPTKGIDVATKAAVHRFMSELATQGIAIILVVQEPVLAVLTVAGCLVLAWLPGYLEHTLVPGVGPLLGLEPLTCQVRRVTWRGLDLALVTAGRGVIWKIGEWCEGTAGPPAASVSAAEARWDTAVL